MLAENAVPMPASGLARPDFNCSNIRFTSPLPSVMLPMTSDTDPTVFSSPQNVPSRPRKISTPGHVARQFPAFVQARGDPVEQAAHRGGRDGEVADVAVPVALPRRQHAGHRRQQLGRGQRGQTGARGLVGLQPRDLRRQAQHLPQVPDDAQQQDQQDQAVEHRAVEERRDQHGRQQGRPSPRPAPGTPAFGGRSVTGGSSWCGLR